MVRYLDPLTVQKNLGSYPALAVSTLLASLPGAQVTQPHVEHDPYTDDTPSGHDPFKDL
jgi:hypothetical protein